MSSRLSVGYLAACAAATALYFALPLEGQAALYVAIGLSSAAAILYGARTRLAAGRERLPWYLFAVGIAAQAFGDAIFNAYDLFADGAPDVSIADAFYLAGYPFLVAGMAVLVRNRGAVRGRGALIDATIITLGIALAQWIFLMDPAVHSDGTVFERIVVAAYPAADVLLLAVLAHLVLTPAWRLRSFRFLAASGLFLLAADEIYGAAGASYSLGSWADALWLLSYGLWGAAALHPSVGDLARVGDRRGTPRLTRGRLVLLAFALLVGPTVLIAERAASATTHALLVAVGAAVLALLVLARVRVLVADIDDSRRSERVARDEAEAARRLVEEQNDRLRELDRLKTAFVASVSHDLRTPLTSIRGFVELLLDERSGPLTADQAGFLSIVDRNSARLLRLVNDLLLAAQLQAGAIELSTQELELDQVAADCAAASRPVAANAGVELDLRTRPLRVVGDRDKLAQLLDNLVSNAIKFTPAGGNVSIALDSDGEHAVVEVRDTGLGIGDDELEQLFQPFARSSSAVARQIPGTGLGLVVAKAVVEAHGGRIDVESEPGVGTTFRVLLPLAATSAADGTDSRIREPSRSVPPRVPAG